MKIDDIIKLADAGFTKEDITKLMQIGKPESPVPQTPPAQAAQSVQQTQQTESVEQLLDRHFANLTQLLQNNAIHNAPMPETNPEQTVDDILASIISPKGENL